MLLDHGSDEIGHDEPLTRRKFVRVTGTAAAALAVLGLPRVAHAQQGWKPALLDPTAQLPTLEDLNRAKNAYLQHRSDAGFVEWTEAAVNYGDFETAKALVRRVLPDRANWGEFGGRLDWCYGCVRSREVEVTTTVPAKCWGAKVANIHTPLTGIPPVPKAGTRVLNAASYEWKVDGLGNSYIEAVLKPDEPMQVVSRATVVPWNYRAQVANYVPGDAPEEARTYLGKTYNKDGTVCIIPDGPAVQAICDRLQLKELSDPDKVERILDWAWRNLRSVPELKGAPRTSETLMEQVGGENCQDHAIARVALARAVGIPSRMNAGCVIFDDGKRAEHQIAEYYLNGVGWVMPNWPNWTFCKDWFPRYHYTAYFDEYTCRLDFLDGIIHNPPYAPASMKVLREWV